MAKSCFIRATAVLMEKPSYFETPAVSTSKLVTWQSQLPKEYTAACLMKTPRSVEDVCVKMFLPLYHYMQRSCIGHLGM